MDIAKGPELKPIEVVGSDLNIIIHTTMLEEEFLVAPEGGDGVRTGDDPANQLVFAAELGRLIKCKHLEHYCVHWNYSHLVLEVVLILISPTVDIIGLDLKLEGPVRLLLLVAVLIKLGQLHDTGATNMICHTGQVFSNGLSSALVVELTQDGHPTVLEEVERFLAVEGEHSQDVS